MLPGVYARVGSFSDWITSIVMLKLIFLSNCEYKKYLSILDIRLDQLYILALIAV